MPKRRKVTSRNYNIVHPKGKVKNIQAKNTLVLPAGKKSTLMIISPS